jgi:plasmid stabilization system protein ParE
MVMKKERVILSLKAKESLRDIVLYLKEHASPSTAEYVRKGIIEQCKNLKNFSGFAKERYLDFLPNEYRSVCKWDYLIIYTIKDKEIRILNIIHTHRHPVKRKNI